MIQLKNIPYYEFPLFKGFMLNLPIEQRIINVVSHCTQISKDRIVMEDGKKGSRKREVVEARQLSMTFIKMGFDVKASEEKKEYSLKLIGSFFGGRDHSTVIHSINTANDLKCTDKKFRDTYNLIKSKLNLIGVKLEKEGGQNEGK